MRDQPESGLDRAVWWTEHVLRHAGGRHLRAPAANMSWREYLDLDLFLLLGSAVVRSQAQPLKQSDEERRPVEDIKDLGGLVVVREHVVSR
ncbi:UDP-glycosyltransferase 33F4 [Operophtera brumata]|uniref:UDP-glycosyltransferase 33F4 n=1 Tax=Operophtera brumata TaxID=104452 RepID=A0A0L7LHA7_OPEBR|nr:UDP-glycosyltransferase 33F4 [Operophtera brumata]